MHEILHVGDTVTSLDLNTQGVAVLTEDTP